jgi:hypothetical protein
MLVDLAPLGWKAFQDLCVAIAAEVLGRPVQIFLPARDGGRDGAFIGTWSGAPDDPTAKSTIQCKFTSKSHGNLTFSQLQPELNKVRRLVRRRLAHDYIIMSNAGISGEADAQICDAFRQAGVRQCRVFGRDWIIAQLQERPRLRMMVPRVYGIGDLSQILDDRAYIQARYILSAMGDDLRCFVPTAAHRQAVNALTTHGFVLLLGDPASGKSTIAAILALGALDEGGSGAIRISSSDQLERWNPNEKQFLWVDDAFGSNQYDASKVDGWNVQLPLLRAAVRQGARIVFTSRNYIWEAARPELRISQFPLFKESQVIINVQELTPTERAQVLYNHVKLGGQPLAFRQRIKPLLSAVAGNNSFLPEIARRLGNPVFTKNLILSEQPVIDFVQHPVEFLKEILEGLDDPSRASIALIFLNGAPGVPSPLQPGEDLDTVIRLTGVSAPKISRALERLNGSLTLLVEHPEGRRWAFRHPTIADAFAGLVSSSPELVELYVRGAKLDRLLAEVVCDASEITRATVRVPTWLYPIIQQRLRGHPIDSALIRFLTNRCDPAFLATYIHETHEIFDLSGRLLPDLAHDSFGALLAKIHTLGMLPEEVRRATVDKIEEAALTWLDAGVYHDAALRSLFTAEEYSVFCVKFRKEWIDDLPESVFRFSSADEMSLFQGLRDNLEYAAKFFGGSPEVDKKFQSAFRRIDEHLSELEDEQPTRPSSMVVPLKPSGGGSAMVSIFEDIDEDGRP